MRVTTLHVSLVVLFLFGVSSCGSSSSTKSDGGTDAGDDGGDGVGEAAQRIHGRRR